MSEQTTTTNETTTEVEGAHASGVLFGNAETEQQAQQADEVKQTEGSQDGKGEGEQQQETEAVIKRPGKDATAEEWDAFYKSIGKPEKASDYEVSLPENDTRPPEQMEAERALIQEMFHEAGITPEQGAKLLEFRNKIFQEQTAAAQKAEAERVAAIKAKNETEAADLAKEWGERNDENMEYARRAIRQFMPADKNVASRMISAIEGVVGYRETIKMLHGIGKGLAEGDAAGLGETQGAAQKSTAEILYGGSAKQ